MIINHEGRGGWTIEVKNGSNIKKFECMQYAYKDKNGVRWFDFDRAMKEAQEYDQQYRAVKSEHMTAR